MNDTEKTSIAIGTTSTDATILDPTSGFVTMINTYEIRPERADELVEFLIEATRSSLRHVPGFVSANLHVALDRSHVVNYAQWESREALAAARDNAQIATLMREQMKIATSFAPLPYELRASIPAAR